MTSPQSDLLKAWLTDKAQLLAMLTLPESLFSNPAYAKTIFVLRKQEEEFVQPFVYPFTDLQDHDQVVHFMESFQNWLKDSEI